jgi:hypothetical protein
VGTETISVSKAWIEIEPTGTLIGIQNMSSTYAEIVFAADPPGLTDQGVAIESAGTLTTIPTGRVFARLVASSPYTVGRLAVLTTD